MSWKNRYLTQAENARHSAQHYAKLGEESAAKFWLDVALTYEELAKEEKEDGRKTH